MKSLLEITKCANHECYVRQDCFRFTCEPNQISQYYEVFKPSNNNRHYFNCDNFIRNNNFQKKKWYN